MQGLRALRGGTVLSPEWFVMEYVHTERRPGQLCGLCGGQRSLPGQRYPKLNTDVASMGSLFPAAEIFRL